MEIIYISRAISSLVPNAQFKFNDNDLDSLEWFSPEIPQPSKKAILDQAKLEEEKEQTEAANRELARTSAIAKLAALGLTEDEISALL